MIFSWGGLMARPATRKGKKDLSHRLGSVIKDRADHAEEMAKSPTITVTLRIPAAFNEWLDAYRHLSYPLRVGKQELVVEGMKFGYMRRGEPGEPILEAELVLRKARR